MDADAPRKHIPLPELVAHALRQGIAQVQAVGSPLNPFFLDEAGNVYFLFDGGKGIDPMAMALQAIQEKAPNIRRAVLIVDSRIAFADGKKWDAIVAMGCEREGGDGAVFAQRYVPKGLFRKFRVEGEQEEVAGCRNFIEAALAPV